MIGAATLLPKDDQAIPDNYGMTIIYISGKKEEFEIAEHKIIDTVRVYSMTGDFTNESGNKYRLEPAPVPLLEFITKEDEWKVRPMTAIQGIDFDKRWTKFLELRKKQTAKAA